MRKFLFTTLPTNDLGLLTRSLPIARQLAQRGHQVAFCSPGPAPDKLIAEAGFDNLLPRHPLYYAFTQKADLSGFYRMVQAGRRDFGNPFSFLVGLLRAAPRHVASPSAQIWDMDHLAALSGMLSANFVRASCQALATLIGDFQPDVVVDFWNPFACIAARITGKPLATVIQADMHPGSRGFIWWRERPADLPSPLPVVNGVLAEYDLPPVDKVRELCLGDLTLVLGMPETDPLPEDVRVTYVGPLLWQKPGVKLPDWVKVLDNDRPVVWAYSGNPRYFPVRSPVDSAVVLQACSAALADEDVQVVLTTGHHALPKDTLPLPPNFRHTPFLPGLAMAERSDLLIHHGGYGSCQTGLYTGTPAVIIPTYSERESNARRVAAVGAGEFVLPVEGARSQKHVQVVELRAKVRQVLTDPSYAANARRASQKLRAYGGAPEAARLVESCGIG
jgi:UDP:flavonoid glycosyltransferase YjiC (YdhE family)